MSYLHKVALARLRNGPSRQSPRSRRARLDHRREITKRNSREIHDFQSSRRRFRALTLQIDNPLNVALFLDLDGTVLDIAAAPRGVSTPIGLTATLRRLQQVLGGAIAILTGRKIDEVDRLLAPLRLTAAGVHGGELRFAPEGRIEVAGGPVPAALVDGLERLARSIPGVVVEHKGIAVALHYRAVPAMELVLEKELQGLLDTHTTRLVLSHGRRVFELAPASSTKGTALARLMQLPSFQGRRPVMIGDDLPDEVALETATRLGGLALKVRGEHFENGAIQFRDPAHVRRWLHHLAETLDS